MSGDGGVVECIGKIQKETPQTAAAWLSQADDAGSGVRSPVDLEGEGQRDLTLNGWPGSSTTGVEHSSMMGTFWTLT